MPVNPPNLVSTPRADLAEAPAADLSRQPEGSAVRQSTIPASIIIRDQLSDIQWDSRPFDSGVYTDYRITLRIVEDTATAELSPQGGDDSYLVEYVAMAKPTLRLVAEWTAERAGQPPENPAKDLSDPNAVYLRGEWNPGDWELDSDGVTNLFRTAGRYEYGFKNPRIAKYGAGLPPWAAELLGVGTRPYIYGTPNVSGIWPEGVTPTAAIPRAVQALPNTPPREGQPGLAPTLTSGSTGSGAVIPNYQQSLADWINAQGQPPGGA